MMQQDDLIGTTLGNYRILETIGQGGMARVYKAHQENLGRDVAIKVLPPWYTADRSFVERFNLEARLVASLSHPNIVTVHDANEQNGHLYIVMQLVDGGTFKHRLDHLQRASKMIDPTEVVSIFVQLADALSYAHAQGVIHRDIKPVNVLLDRSGRPILSDFGIAKVMASTKTHLTRPGAGVGTPEYMSPEQCQGGPVDGRADIYALGVMLFEAQTGRTPFISDNYPALAHSHIYEQPPRPRAVNPTIHPAIEHIILTALTKNPMQRYQTARDMAEALKHALTVMNGTALPHLTTNYYTAQQMPTTMQPVTPYAPLQPPMQQQAQQQSQQPLPPMQQPQQPMQQPLPPNVQQQMPPAMPIQQIPTIPPVQQISPQQIPTSQFPPSLRTPTMVDNHQNVLYTCFNCQHPNRPQMRYCTRCGYLLNQCTVCGERNPVSNRFCTKCGQPLAV
ncbi:STKc_PknB_like and DZR domain-containing protein [Ktedonobacteria bacterium brp13]|nr:STKc_PknB_like and DZR domain-containing protein [Ktedonobacteria bacterium brp13]